MNRRLATILIVASLSIVLLSVVVALMSRGRDAAGEDVVVDDEAIEAGMEVILYFPGGDRLLHGESRGILAGSEAPVRERARAIVEGLLEGSTGQLQNPFPEDVAFSDVLDVGDATIYVDLRLAEGKLAPSLGSDQERLMLYSLVNSLTLNLEEIDRVALLWNGAQTMTIAGHLDATRPFLADPSLLARDPATVQ